jgi:hypothetical protein
MKYYPESIDDASHSTMKGLSKSGSCNTGVVDSSCFNFWNAED